MSARLARLVVYVGAAVLPDSATRVRYREQWLADVDGAAEVGLSPLSVALGAAAAAVRLAATHPRSVAALIRVAVLPGVSMRVRRTLGLVQLAVAAPYLWAVVFYGYARLRLGVSHAELLGGQHDPKELIVWWFPPFWAYPAVVVWLAIGGWIVAVALAPAGLVLAAGGQRAARWLPLAGTLAAAAVTPLAISHYGDALRIWLLD